MNTSQKFRGDNRLLLGIILGLLHFGYLHNHL